jgi:site-specific DNA-cytosine methylase
MTRSLSKEATGPPYFYYENVALAPRSVWKEISRKLYDIEPEFVDSKFFCAATRERGYIHNLPVENRAPLRPLPPKTIFDAFPHYKKWWPSWDTRKQLDCLETRVASPNQIKQIECALASSSNPPSLTVQKYVVDECRKWNLVWVGKKKVAPLEQDEMEYLQGFPRNHTRGVANKERYKCLGNSFQVDTVGYHLSVLKDMFPNGVNVLSLFTGIGGGEVALHRIGIHMKTVISVEISEVNRRILRGWWDQTQTGNLIEISDVKSLSNDRIASFISRYGRFDLVIGGLDAEQPALFYHFSRILNAVKSATTRL